MGIYTLITGASGGLGSSCAVRLSKNQNIILAGSRIDVLEDIRSKCSDPEKHLIWQCDFAKERCSIFESLKNLIEANSIRIENYIHFAGLTQTMPIRDFRIPYVDKIFNVNFFSIIEILRVLLKRKNAKNLKTITLISALFSIRGDVGNSIYAASKGAINSLVISLARELAPIRVNSILPGAIETPMTTSGNVEHLNKLVSETPLGLGHPNDITNLIEFLISDNASWITGQNIVIDGGRSTK